MGDFVQKEKIHSNSKTRSTNVDTKERKKVNPKEKKTSRRTGRKKGTEGPYVYVKMDQEKGRQVRNIADLPRKEKITVDGKRKITHVDHLSRGELRAPRRFDRRQEEERRNARILGKREKSTWRAI